MMPNQTILKLAVAVLLLMQSCMGLYFVIETDPVCIELDAAPGKTYKFSYDVNAEYDQNVELTVERSRSSLDSHLPSPRQDDPAWQRTLHIGMRKQLELDGFYGQRLCFRSTDRSERSVSIYFYTEDQAHFMELAKKSQLFDLISQISQAANKMREINRNEQFSEQRSKIQSEALKNHENTVKSYAWLKILLIVAVAIIQLVVLKKTLDRKNQGYESV